MLTILADRGVTGKAERDFMLWVAQCPGHLHLVDRILKLAAHRTGGRSPSLRDLQVAASMRGLKVLVDLKEILTGMGAVTRAAGYTQDETVPALDVMASIAAGIVSRLEPHIKSALNHPRQIIEEAA